LRPLLGALAHVWTTAPIDLALLKIVEKFQLADHPPVRKFDAERAVRSGGQLALLADFLVGTLSNVGSLLQIQQLTTEDAGNYTAFTFEAAHPVGKLARVIHTRWRGPRCSPATPMPVEKEITERSGQATSSLERGLFR